MLISQETGFFRAFSPHFLHLLEDFKYVKRQSLCIILYCNKNDQEMLMKQIFWLNKTLSTLV